MTRLLPIVVVAAVLSAAGAAAPDGFRESARLTPIAQALSVPDAKVYCALTVVGWRDSLKVTHPTLEWSAVQGYTRISEHATYLAPWVCQPLERWKRGKTVPLDKLGAALLTLTHESIHLRGVTDERVTECTALRELRAVARTHFGISREKAWRQVWRGVSLVGC